jgi:undecaprenyl-diphosphatase
VIRNFWSGLARIDARASERLRSRAAGRAARFALAAVAHSADSLLCIPALAALWWLEGFSFRGIVVRLALGYAASVAAVVLLKLAFPRPRPEGDWGGIYRRTDPGSFPSGHAARTMALAAAAAVAGLPLLAFLLASWSIGVGLARAALGVHYISDLAAGWLVGTAAGALGAGIAIGL